MYVIFLFSFTTLKAVKISKNTKFTHIKFSIKLCSYHGGPPYSPVNPANEKTYEFLSKYLNDLSKVFESDYWHLGGDEVSIGCVSNLKGTNDFLRDHNIQLNNLQDYYIKREREILKNIKSDKIAGYWYRGEGQTYNDGDILQYWGGSGGLQGHLNKYPNNYFIISPSDVYYLDCGYPNQYAGGSWCGGIHNWKDIWRLNPLSQVDANSKSKLLGGELTAWSEMNNEFNLPTKLFPRGAAMSFRHWNPNGNYSESKVYEMMIKHQYRLKAFDIPHQKSHNEILRGAYTSLLWSIIHYKNWIITKFLIF